MLPQVSGTILVPVIRLVGLPIYFDFALSITAVSVSVFGLVSGGMLVSASVPAGATSAPAPAPAVTAAGAPSLVSISVGHYKSNYN